MPASQEEYPLAPDNRGAPYSNALHWYARRGGLLFLSFSHAIPPYGRVVCFQALDVSMTRFRTRGKAVERPMPVRWPGGE
jgi:hypothetical protein